MSSERKNPPIHPGTYIRQSILPAKLSVKKAAEMLGVGRPAVSTLLNGRAALSPNMAMRFEKAFQANGSALLEMQARYDDFEARADEDDIVVRAYAPAYLQITARQIDAWADGIDARGQLAAVAAHAGAHDWQQSDCGRFPGLRQFPAEGLGRTGHIRIGDTVDTARASPAGSSGATRTPRPRRRRTMGPVPPAFPPRNESPQRSCL